MLRSRVQNMQSGGNVLQIVNGFKEMYGEAKRLGDSSTCASLNVQRDQSLKSTECRVRKSTISVGSPRMMYAGVLEKIKLFNELGMKSEEIGKDNRKVQVQCPIQCVQKEKSTVLTVCSAQKIQNDLQSDRSKMNVSTLMGEDLRYEVHGSVLSTGWLETSTVCLQCQEGDEARGDQLKLRSAKRDFPKLNFEKLEFALNAKTNGDSKICFGSKLMIISAGNST